MAAIIWSGELLGYLYTISLVVDGHRQLGCRRTSRLGTKAILVVRDLDAGLTGVLGGADRLMCTLLAAM